MQTDVVKEDNQINKEQGVKTTDKGPIPTTTDTSEAKITETEMIEEESTKNDRDSLRPIDNNLEKPGEISDNHQVLLKNQG